MTTTTDSNGYYVFTGLSNGTYTITLVPPGGIYNPEIANVGTVNSLLDGSAEGNELAIDNVQLKAGQTGINYDFGDAWFGFTSATADADRVLELAVGPDHFPYWVVPLGIDDTLTATFGVIDAKKRKLTVGPAALPFTGDAAGGWTLRVDNTSPLFPFLKRNSTNKVHMVLSYAMPA